MPEGVSKTGLVYAWWKMLKKEEYSNLVTPLLSPPRVTQVTTVTTGDTDNYYKYE